MGRMGASRLVNFLILSSLLYTRKLTHLSNTASQESSLIQPTAHTSSLSSLLLSLPKPIPKTAPTTNGAPHVLILASSGMRCADLVRELRDIVAKESGVVPAVEGDKPPAANGKAKGKGKSTEGKGNGEIAKVRSRTLLELLSKRSPVQTFPE